MAKWRSVSIPTPPVAPARPVTTVLHGDVLVDEYRWLAERDNPEVMAYIEAENRYTDAVMAGTEDLQEELYREMLGRLKEADVFVPMRVDGYLYYYRSLKEKQYPIYCRRKDVPDAPEEVYFDLNELAAEGEYVDVGAFALSHDHRYLAYSLDAAGDESFTLAIKDLDSGAPLPERIEATFGQVAWAADNQTLFYVALDASGRASSVRRHRIGTPASESTSVYEEADPAFHLSVATSKTKAYVFLSAESLSSSEVRFLPADDPTGEFRVVGGRRPGVEYDVDDGGDRLVITSDLGTGTVSVLEAPYEACSPEQWRPVPLDPGLDVESVDVFRDHYAVYGRRGGLDQVVIVDRASGRSHSLAFPEPAYSIGAMSNPDYNTKVLRLRYSSPVTPTAIYDYDMGTGALAVVKQLEIPAGYDKDLYAVERTFARAPDGVLVPVSLAYRKDRMGRDGANPCLLTGYGAYGETVDPEFVPERVSLLDRGFVMALAHVRGGGELGGGWHEAGRLLNKQTSFTDFVACGEHLIAEGYTSSAGLVAAGRSAGGLLVGACANLRPNLFRAVLAEVPFVDMINTMLDPSLALTAVDYEEWGDPADEGFYRCLRSYSPYDGVRAQAYPAMLVVGALRDARVPYWEPLKWVARLRARNTGGEPLVLRMETAGHAGESGRLDYLRRQAFEDAFLIGLLGLGGPGSHHPEP